jgi:chromosome segregation ATPase
MRVQRSIGVVLASLVLTGCVAASENTPASQRGFFGGLGAAASGNDERRAQRMEAEASASEQRARQLEARANQAETQAAVTSGQVRAAEQRLASIQGEVQRQRQRLAAVQRAGKSPEEAGRLNAELEAIDAERRAAAASTGGVSNATLQGLENRTRRVNEALNRLGAV